MFNTYCNEIPLIPKLSNTPLYHKLVDKTKLNITKITHMVINFIDDSTNIIGFNDHGKVQGYMEKYYVLL